MTKNRERKSYPVLVTDIGPEHPLYSQGDRVKISQVDGDTHLCKSKEDADEFMRIHCLEAVSEEKMKQLRLEQRKARLFGNPDTE